MVKVCKRNASTDVCDMSLLIEKDEQYVEWSEDDLVQSIVDEVEISENSAREIAETVKQKIKDVAETMGWDSVDTSFIREFVSSELLSKKKYRKKANKYNLIGLSPTEIESLIENEEGLDNSNVTQNPEAVNFMLSEIILKKYALQELIPEHIAKAHLDGRIYIHDLGSFATRCYAFSKYTEVEILNELGEKKEITLYELWNVLRDVEEKQLNDTQILKNLYDLNIKIKDRGCFVPLERIICSKETKNMYDFIFNDCVLTVTEEHPCIVVRDNKTILVRADEVEKTDLFFQYIGEEIDKERKSIEACSFLPSGTTVDIDELDMCGAQPKRIINISKCEETDVFDITTQTGFFQDINGIVNKQCSGNSIEYVKKNGLKLKNVQSISKPAKEIDVILSHISTFALAVQTCMAGAIGFDAVNTFLAPYLVGLSDKEIYQSAQRLIFSESQSAGARGGQNLFMDLNVHISVPKHFAQTKAMGPKGEYCKIVEDEDGNKKTVPCDKKDASEYQEFNPWAQKFLVACMKVLEEGDAAGAPFAFPKFLVHFDKDSFSDDNKHIADAVFNCAAKNGSPYFLFDRGDSVRVAQCCRMSLEMDEEDLKKAMHSPEDIRFQALQNVTMNLPQIAYEAKLTAEEGKEKSAFVKIAKETIDLIIEAHKVKLKHIKKMLKIDKGILSFLKDGMDGKGYVDPSRFTYLVGIVGLNEAVHVLCGEQLHQSDIAHQTGMYLIAELSMYVYNKSKELGIKLAIEETPGESMTQRVAQMDLKHHKYGELAKNYVQGDLETNNVYYTNSVHLINDAGVDYIQRIEKQGQFHPLVTAGAITHVFTGEKLPPAESIRNLVKKTYDNTETTQMTISPEYSVCRNCNIYKLGLKKKCSKCGSEMDWFTRIVGYFSKIQNWSRNKKLERTKREKHYVDKL